MRRTGRPAPPAKPVFLPMCQSPESAIQSVGQSHGPRDAQRPSARATPITGHSPRRHTVTQIPNRLHMHMAAMVALEATIDQTLEQLIPEVADHPAVSALLRECQTMVKGQL